MNFELLCKHFLVWKEVVDAKRTRGFIKFTPFLNLFPRKWLRFSSVKHSGMFLFMGHFHSSNICFLIIVRNN